MCLSFCLSACLSAPSACLSVSTRVCLCTSPCSLNPHVLFVPLDLQATKTSRAHTHTHIRTRICSQAALTVGSLAEYMSDPLHPGQLALQDNLVMEAVTACCSSASEAESIHGIVGEVLHEVRVCVVCVVCVCVWMIRTLRRLHFYHVHTHSCSY